MIELPFPGIQFEEETWSDTENYDLEDGGIDCDPLFGHESEDYEE